MKKKPAFLVLFYILVVYIALQFFWWAYLIISTSTSLIQLQGTLDGLSQAEQSQLSLKKTFMIIGEGSVFISLIAFGIYQIRKSIFKEFALAQQQQNFMMAVTHELKSPLASIKLQWQTLQKHKNLSEEQREKLLRNTNKDIERLEVLTENILTASNIKHSQVKLASEQINIKAFIENCIQPYLLDETIRIERQIQDNTIALADKNALTSVFNNLIENSIKYNTGKTTNITIETITTNNHILIEFKDNGIGIPLSEADLIFKQFYRSGDELTRKTKGTGLGLFIVKQLMLQMKGNIKLNTSYTEGAGFILQLPKH